MVEEAIPVDPFFIDTGSLQVRTDTVIGCFFFLSLLWNIPPTIVFDTNHQRYGRNPAGMCFWLLLAFTQGVHPPDSSVVVWRDSD